MTTQHEQAVDMDEATVGNAGVLRFIAAGSVDDGKSTLIGRLLHDTGAVFDDQLAQLQGADVGEDPLSARLALLTDGLRAEREQGITIDIAHRYFATQRRKFIVIDAPGHVQYTPKMVTGASVAEVAVILVDVRRGLAEQSRRHAFLASLLGVRELLFAVNKMDLVDHSQRAFEAVEAQLVDWARGLGTPRVGCLPVSALRGDNVVHRSAAMPWYQGPSLLEYLEQASLEGEGGTSDVRLPVQWVLRDNADGGGLRRGYCGVVAGGELRPGAEVEVMPSGVRTRIAEVHTYDGPLRVAMPGQSVAVYLEHDADVSRGDILCGVELPPRCEREVEATLSWMSRKPLEEGQRFALKHTTRWLSARVSEVISEVDITTLEPQATVDGLHLNCVGRVRLQTSAPLVYDAYERNRTMGAFILVDEATHDTVAAGMLVDDHGPTTSHRRDTLRPHA